MEYNGELLELGRAKQRALLAMLLVHANHVVSADRLVEELWEGQPPTLRRAPFRCRSPGCAGPWHRSAEAG